MIETEHQEQSQASISLSGKQEQKQEKEIKHKLVKSKEGFPNKPHRKNLLVSRHSIANIIV